MAPRAAGCSLYVLAPDLNSSAICRLLAANTGAPALSLPTSALIPDIPTFLIFWEMNLCLSMVKSP